MCRPRGAPVGHPGIGTLVFLLTGTLGAALDAQAVAPVTVEVVGRLPPEYLGESSGIAASRRHPGVFWTHNDSGDGPFVFAIRLSGDILVRYRLTGARAVDWEDIALGPCPGAPEGDCLYLADTGDNTLRRQHGVLYVAREPNSIPVVGPRDTLELAARRVRFQYRDGPQDVESVAVSPSGQVVLVTRGRSGTIKLYRLPALDGDSLGPLDPSEELQLTAIPATGRVATGAAFSPTGEWLVVRTYTELFFYRWQEDAAVFIPPYCHLGFREPQGEAVDFLDEDTLVLTSESRAGYPGPITIVTCLRSPRR